MPSWWRKITLEQLGGDPGGKGPWPYLALKALGIDPNTPGRSWAAKIWAARPDLHFQSTGSFAKHMVDPDEDTVTGPAEKNLFLQGKLAGGGGGQWRFDSTGIKFDSDKATFDGAVAP